MSVAESPSCSRCGDISNCRLRRPDQRECESVPLCRACFPIVLREMSQPEYELTEADRERARQEIEERASHSGRLTTETLVIHGSKIRFKTAKELLGQYGMPEELPKAIPARDSPRILADDPFDF